MAYRGDLGQDQQLLVENRGNQTLITVSSSRAGQQQSQSSGFETGQWVAPPTLFRVTTGFVLRIEAGQPLYVQLQAGQMQVLATAPTLLGAEVLPLQPIADSTQAQPNSMQPMQPMQPMQMGNMQMQMQPMEMRMGNMEMRMGETLANSSNQRFCPQCGATVQANDRFCAKCGNQLTRS
jgi:NADH pyrophosphatase NudC (nudix superfamily)